MGQALFGQDFIGLGVDLLLIGCAQFALMLHLGGPSLRVAGVACIGHWVFALFRQSEFLLWLRVFLRCCKFGHATSPCTVISTQGSFLLEDYTQFMTTTEELMERVKSLSVEEQISVIRFIEYLERGRVPSRTSFLQAADDFIAEHPELLRRLAQ